MSIHGIPGIVRHVWPLAHGHHKLILKYGFRFYISCLHFCDVVSSSFILLYLYFPSSVTSSAKFYTLYVSSSGICFQLYGFLIESRYCMYLNLVFFVWFHLFLNTFLLHQHVVLLSTLRTNQKPVILFICSKGCKSCMHCSNKRHR